MFQVEYSVETRPCLPVHTRACGKVQLRGAPPNLDFQGPVPPPSSSPCTPPSIQCVGVSTCLPPPPPSVAVVSAL